MSSAGDKYGGIRSMPNNQKFRDNYDATFGKKREFCQYCGAGIGEHFREGEGTCRICDPGGVRGFQGGEAAEGRDVDGYNRSMPEGEDWSADTHSWLTVATGEYGNEFRCRRCGEEHYIEGTGSSRGRGLPEKGCPGK